jgi:DNA repair exonuclease SbcCD ATPase subunit
MKQLVLACTVSLLAGCAGVPHPLSPETRPETYLPTPLSDAETGAKTDAALFLRYFRDISILSPEELRREYGEALDAYLEDTSRATRMRLVMLLSLSNTAMRDDDRAIALLQDILTDEETDDAALGDLAYLLWIVLSDRREGEARYQEVQQRLAAEQRRLASLQQQLKRQGQQHQRLERRLEEETSRSLQLEQQLEALKKIERSLRREKPPSADTMIQEK